MREINLKTSKWYYVLLPMRSYIITCIDKAGKMNAITLDYVFPASSKPPRLMIGIRPDNYSHSLIKETKEFVVNTPTLKLVKEIEFCGRRSGRNVDKFKETGLTPLPARLVRPPIIKECVSWVECKVTGQIDFENRTMFLGEVVAAYAKKEIYREEMYDVGKAKFVYHVGKNRYAILSDETIQPQLEDI